MAEVDVRHDTDPGDLPATSVDDAGPDHTEQGAALGALGGLVVGAAAGSLAGPVGVVVGAVVGGVTGTVAGGMAGAAADNAEVPPATSVPVTGNSGYGADVDAGAGDVIPATSKDTM